MKKILVFLFTVFCAILLTGCQDIKDIVKQYEEEI